MNNTQIKMKIKLNSTILIQNLLQTRVQAQTIYSTNKNKEQKLWRGIS